MIDDRPLYPVDPWRIRELTFDASFAARNETIFSLANGHLGMRGNLEEEAGNVVHGTYVNGFYEEAPIAYGEAAYGYARNHQVLLNVADGKRIQLVVGDEPLDLATGTVAGEVGTGEQPRSMVLAEDGASLYVVNYVDGTVSKVRTADMVVLQAEHSGVHPVGITYDAATRRIWVANYAGSLSVFQDT